MIDDSVSTKTSTSGGRYGNTASTNTPPDDITLAWRAQVDASTGNTRWLADGPDGKTWRLSPILMNMETWWTNESDYPLKVAGQSWRYLDDAKRDIESRHRMIELYKRATDTAKKVKGDEKESEVEDAGVKLYWRDLPNCGGQWLYWDYGSRWPHIAGLSDFSGVEFRDGRLWLGPIDDPHRMSAKQA